jgi:hypothetical protein
MKQEDKDLLLKDLCARLSYGVKCAIQDEKKAYTLNRIEADYKNGHLFNFIEKKNDLNMQVYLSEVKPYLFPLSSMTEEQKTEWDYIDYYADHHEAVDWLNKNHFDYRGLIEKDLAIDVTGLNIY